MRSPPNQDSTIASAETSGVVLQAHLQPVHLIPLLTGGAGDWAAQRFFEFFTVNIRNPNTRAAYGRAGCKSVPALVRGAGHYRPGRDPASARGGLY